MPDIGEGLTEAEIIKWFVKVGDTVDIDQILVEVETAKTVVEIPSPFAGKITSIAAAEGETVDVDAVLFVIGGDSDAASDGVSSESSDTERVQEPTLEPVASTVASSYVPAASSLGAGLKAMPIIRRLAKERGIDLAQVKGSGPGGVVTRADLETQPTASTEQLDMIPLRRTRQTIANHMAKSWRTIPHVTVQAELRAGSLLASRATPDGESLPLEAVISQVVMPLLQTYPEFNAEYTDGAMAVKPGIHMGFAVDTEAGLIVVVVRNADRLSVSELAAEFGRLAQAARKRTITLEEITGQTFTISNIGALGGGHGTPIIPLGTSSIMSIGRATQQPVVIEGELAIGLVAPIDLSYDHRLIDGSLGQRFLSDLISGLESPVPT